MSAQPDLEKRIDDLISQMTLEEKVGQLHQIPFHGQIDLDLVRNGHLGSLLCASNPTAGNTAQEKVFASYLNDVQRIAVEESRLGIPLLFGRDVIHGHRTVAPIPLGQAASWDCDLVRACAEDAAREARADGLNWTFTPMLDIARDPRWGRIAEGFGEDPCLASRMAEAAVLGYQGENLSDDERILACAKHYVGYGAAEGGRDYNTTEITTSTLRNVYTPPFQAAVQAGVGSVMAAFHEIGGVPTTGNPALLRRLLKEEWGFDGLVVSDWGAVEELVKHGVAADRREAARIALEAGIDIDMVSKSFHEHLASLVSDGTVCESLLDDAVRRVLRTKFRLGLFDRPYTDEAVGKTVHLRQDHRQRARELATKSLVLLRNESNLLPLPRTGRRLAVVGPMANAKGALFGTWTLDGVADDVVPILDAIRSKAETVHTAAASDEMLSLARHCDVIVAVVGETPARSGEDNCVTSLDLPPGQQDLLERLHALGKPLVAVVLSGRPLAINWLINNADAVLWAFHPGLEGGQAIADILFGDASPSGRLPVTLPRSVGQVPIYYSHKATGRPNPPAGRYVDSTDQPLLPFGFGLGYTSFEYSDLRISQGEPHEITATIRNNGDRPGEEVVQLYIRDLVGSITRPVKELKGFQRITLAPGETKNVSFQLHKTNLGYYDNEGRFLIEPGRFKVWVGPDSSRGLESGFDLLHG